jgi:hypothetical protein
MVRGEQELRIRARRGIILWLREMKFRSKAGSCLNAESFIKNVNHTKGAT